MGNLKPNIDASLFKLTDDQKNSGGVCGTKPSVSLYQLEKEFNAFERIDISDARHRQALDELFPSFLLMERDDADWELFLAMSRYDSRHQTFVTGCFDNDHMEDFKLISYKQRYLNGVKWRTRSGSSPNGTPFVRIYTDDGSVYVIEGHRDALTAVLLGLDFIMIPYAGFKLREPAPLQNEVRNKELVFLVEDEAAHRCMAKVAKHLKEAASGIRFIELDDTEKKTDLSDYVRQFDSIEEVIDGLRNRR